MRSKYRTLVAEYGLVAVVFHMSVFSLVGLGGACFFLFGFASEAHAAGPVAAATAGYALTQVTSPFRYLLTFAVTPFLAKVFRELRPEA